MKIAVARSLVSRGFGGRDVRDEGRRREHGHGKGKDELQCRLRNDQSLLPMKFAGVTRTIAIACATIFPTPSSTSNVEDGEVADVDDQRHHQEAQALVPEVAAIAAERPEPVPEVVVGHRDEERAGRRQPVVQVGAVEQRDVDEEVDDVARRPDGAELRQLRPVAPLAQCMAGAGAQTRGDGCVPLLHEAGETSGSGGGAALRSES